MRDSIIGWQKILAQGFSSAAELLHFLHLPIPASPTLAEKKFKTRVPRGFAALMEPGNRFDPLLLQVLAVDEELEVSDGFTADPLQELAVNPLQGLIHKYQGRVLLTLTGSCAINCRYCFRRHFPYQENNPGREGWQSVLEYIAQDASIHEVILSGGEPLLASDKVLADLLAQLSLIPHLRTLRFHTRMPVVLPERITQDLIDVLLKTRLKKVVVLHCNHAQELDARVHAACKLLSNAGCCLLNQSVLLAGVNDCASVLSALSNRLFDFGILPYYLHLLDKVQGAAHFDIPLAKAKLIFQELQRLLPGYLVPRLVCEEARGHNKTLVM